MIRALVALLATTATGGAATAGDPTPPIHQPLRQILHVQFAPGSSAIRPEDGPLLDFIAGVLRAAEDIQLVEVQGYAAANERKPAKIAEARAAAIRAVLVERGVAGERVVARGYAATRPLCAEKTPACQSRNRRGDFLILRRLESKQRPSASAIHGCWTVTDSGEMTSVKTDQELCLTSTAFVVREASGAIVDGWLVTWSATADGWRAEVAGRDGATLPVSFDCKLTEDARLAISGSGGFTRLKLRRASLATAEHAVEGGATLAQSLRDCWRCLRDGRELVGNPMVRELLDEEFYSLRSCRGAMSSIRQAVPESRLPAICKQR